MTELLRITQIHKKYLMIFILFILVGVASAITINTNKEFLHASQNPVSANTQSTNNNPKLNTADSSGNATVDYTQQIRQLDSLAFGMDETGYVTPNVLVNDTTEQQKVTALGLGYMRMDLMYATSGNPNSKIECGGSGCDTTFTGDQWINAIKAAGAQPVISVHEAGNNSEGLNTAQDAANMVKHFNIDTNNYVKYWIIGNEADINNITQQQYSADFNTYYDAMKAIDPTIKIGGPGTAFYDSPNCSTCFLEVFLQLSGSRVDFVDFHGYPQQGNVNGSYSTLFSWATQQGQYVANLRSLIQTYVPSRSSQIGIEVGEWELNWGGSAQDDINFHAVWAADVLGNILSNGGDSMFYGTKSNLLYSSSHMITDQLNNSYQVNLDDTNPAYHGYGMFTGEGLFRHFGTSMVQTSTNVANVDIFASDNPKNIIFINKDPTSTATVSVSLTGVTSGSYDVWRKDDSMASINPPISLGTQTFVNSTFTYTLPPFSVTTFLVNPDGSPTPTPTPTPTSTPTPTPTPSTTPTPTPTPTPDQTCTGDGVYLYQNSNYTGPCTKLIQNISTLTGTTVGNDSLTSVMLVGPYQAILYKNSNYQGGSTTVTANIPDLTGSTVGNDQATSVSIILLLPIPNPDTQPTASYNTSINLTGTKDASIVSVFVDGSSAGVTYPDSTHWQLNNFSLSLGSNAISIYGEDSSSNLSSTTTLSINRNKVGDINGDGSINLTDFSIFAIDWLHSGNAIVNTLSDMNNDGIVNLTDFSIFAIDYGH